MLALELTAASPLQILWFILIAVLWVGYLVLEGFDYGVAMLVPFLAKEEKERRVMVNTIGPVWDGNEVWLLTAGGATFAAFPAWYATLFSGAYLPLFLVLVGLIIRGVSFEYRAKHLETKWRNTFDWMAAIGSFIVPLVFGVAFANFIIGLPVVLAPGSQHLYMLETPFYFLPLFNGFGLLGGLTLVALFIFHGSTYLSLKTKGDLHDRIVAFNKLAGLVSIGLGAIFLLWQQFIHPTGILGWALLVLAALGLAGAWWFVQQGREGIAFISSSAAILFVAVGIFVTMFPGLGFRASGHSFAAEGSGAVENGLQVATASSTEPTLILMTIVAVVFVPIVLAYSAWTYWVFRKRLGVENMPDEVALAS